MLSPVVRDWLKTLGRLEVRRAEIREAQALIERAERTNYRAASRRDVDELRFEVSESMRVYGEQLSCIDVLSRARLFALSDEIIFSCWNRSSGMIGSPDLSALPFEVCWFDVRGYGMEKEGFLRIAFVVTRDGRFLSVYEVDGGHLYIGDDKILTDEGWDPAFLRDAWTVWLMASVVNGEVAQRPASQSFELRRELSKLREMGARIAPPDLYTLRLDARRAGHVVSLLVASRLGPAYRYEVRQHERLYHDRGRWPPTQDQRLAFEKRGRVVQRGSDLDERVVLGLQLRELPPVRPDEWIAWKFGRVVEHQAGPKDKPLRRAVRVK